MGKAVSPENKIINCFFHVVNSSLASTFIHHVFHCSPTLRVSRHQHSSVPMSSFYHHTLIYLSCYHCSAIAPSLRSSSLSSWCKRLPIEFASSSAACRNFEVYIDAMLKSLTLRFLTTHFWGEMCGIPSIKRKKYIEKKDFLSFFSKLRKLRNFGDVYYIYNILILLSNIDIIYILGNSKTMKLTPENFSILCS